MYTAKLRGKTGKLSIHDNDVVSSRRRKRALEEDGDVSDNVFEGSTDIQKSENTTSRKRRMASLNAIAKVTAVLSDYHFEKKETNQLTHHKKESSVHNHSKERVLTQDMKSTSSNSLVNKKALSSSQTTVKSAFTVVPQCRVKPTILSLDKATQTSTNEKCVQTTERTSYVNKQSICTCPNKEPIGISLFFPLNRDGNSPDCPIHIKSNVLVHNNEETLAIPLVKKHYISSSVEPEYTVTMTDNISKLQTNCLHNFLLQHSCETAKLMFLNSLQEKLKKEQVEEDEKPDLSPMKPKNNLFTVPTLTFPSLSVPSTERLSSEDNSKPHRTNEKYRRSSKHESKNSCNGWVFEGAPIHETIKQNNQTFVRKYFPTIRRGDEVIHLQDAVILKSDNEADETDYVARILEFWEDSGGDNSKEMMMSVLWYYKPEQMRVRYFELEIAEMELFASRHKDDNSVACILDKCYVVSYSQYCRFHSQRKLFKEKRTSQNSLVPQSDNMRSRWLPSPTTNLSLVYFCQYGYDYRNGKIIKHY